MSSASHSNILSSIIGKETGCLNNYLTNSKEQSPSSEADTSSASLEISRILSNPKAHYRIHYSPPFVPILSYISPVHALPTNFQMICFNTSLHLRLDLSNGLFPSFPTATLYAPLVSPHTCHMPPTLSFFLV
jgi:hypothetical protein